MVDSIIEEDKRVVNNGNDLSLEIDRLKQLDLDRQRQLETLLSISGNTSSYVGNQLDTIAVLLAVFSILFAAAAIGLGIYINRREKTLTKLLDRSDENLKKQAESEKKAEETRRMINNDLTTLYNRLRKEELKDILTRIEANPNLIQVHTSRLLTMDLEEEHLPFLKNLYLLWGKSEQHRYYNQNLVILLISHFPADIAINRELLPSIVDQLDNTLISVGIDKLAIFLDGLLNDYLTDKYPEAGDYTLRTIQALSKNFNPNYVAIRMLFEAHESKKSRFKIYKLLRRDPGMMFLNPMYNERMINTYQGDPSNSQEEIELLAKMMK